MGNEKWGSNKKHRLTFKDKRRAYQTMEDLLDVTDADMTVVKITRTKKDTKRVPLGTVYVFNSQPLRPFLVCRPPARSSVKSDGDTEVYWQSIDGLEPVCYGFASEWYEELKEGRIRVVYRPHLKIRE